MQAISLSVSPKRGEASKPKESDMPLSIYDIAVAKGVERLPDGGITAQAFYDLDLPFLAGCQRCEATLGPAQSYPSRIGYIRDRECIGDLGFETIAEWDAWVAAVMAERDDPNFDYAGGVA